MELWWMVGVQENLTWDELVTVARTAEDSGYAGLFRSDHYMSFTRPTEEGSLDAWSLLAALSPHTRRLRLGSLVSPVTFRHPSHLAKVVTTVDHTSGGRVELGIGAGWMPEEHHTFGIWLPPVSTRMRMLEEQLEIIHRLWDRNEEEVTFRGDHYRLRGCRALPRPVQQPHPPIILGGGGGRRSAALAARWADEYNLVKLPPDACRERRAGLEAACEAIGRDPSTLRTSVLTSVIIGTDELDVERRTRHLLKTLGVDEDPKAHLSSLGPEWVVGTPARVGERLARYADGGIDRFVAQTMTYDLEAITLMGEAAAAAQN